MQEARAEVRGAAPNPLGGGTAPSRPSLEDPRGEIGREAIGAGAMAPAAAVPHPADGSGLANIDLQGTLQHQQQLLQQISEIEKRLHDTAMAIIRKMS
jgi:hypothetical protein